MLHLFSKNKTIPQKSLNEIIKLKSLVQKTNLLESWALQLSQAEFAEQTNILKQEYKNNSNLDVLIPQAFALVREAARRTLGERMFDVQILGGIILHQGRIAEMKTGEGKTLTSTTAAYLNSITGNPVHIVTVNDYLAKRDAQWMTPVFEYLGQSVGYIVSNMEGSLRRAMYAKDIIYATNNELGFDYLRDNLRLETQSVANRGYHYCIIDEIDSVLIDEARTPLIISGPATDNTIKYKESNSIVSYLKECSKDPNTNEYPDEKHVQLDGDYKLNAKNKNISFTQQGVNTIEKLLQSRKIITGSIEEIENFEFIHYVTQSLRAHKLFFKDIDYIISDENKIEIIDEFTGRVLKGRRYSDGLHQAIEAKEGIRIERQNRTLASVTFQNFFKMYTKLSGMTGTAVTEEKEFIKIYGLDVVELPTNSPIIREDLEDYIYVNDNAKSNAIINEILEVHKKGQPLLIGTASIESSEKFSKLLKRNNINHKVLNAKNHEQEAQIIADAGKKGAVTIATNMAGRGTDIKLGGNLDVNIQDRINNELEELDEIAIQKIREEEILKWQSSYEEVRKLGGLYVLGTERHESRRIDNQLRGRSGRQGDPGKSRFFLSLDDQLLKLFGTGIERMRSLMSKALQDDEPLTHSLISNTMERAQKNVEYRNFEIRKHLLNFDEVLNNQKNTIYSQRETILQSSNLVERLKNNIEQILFDLVSNVPKEDHSKKIIEFLQDTMHASYDLDLEWTTVQIIEEIKNDLEKKSELVGKELFNEIIRMEYLRLIDNKWQEHIAQLEELRQAVYLRSYAQKNPLLEYKIESYEMFDKIASEISIGILRQFIGLRAENIKIQEQNTQPQPMQIHHQKISMLSNPQQQEQNTKNKVSIGTATSPSPTSALKVGRNEPCPCGSRKKYKHCHGKSGN